MKTILNILKICVPIAIALYIVYAVFNNLSEVEKQTLFNAFESANYLIVFIAVLGGVLSHLSRAYRWKFLQEPLGYEFRLDHAFYAVMIGYFANLALPRIGEIIRCGVIAKLEKKDVNKLIGTVVAERIADVLMLGIAILFVLFFEYDVLFELFEQLILALFNKTLDLQTSLMLFAWVLVGGMALHFFIKKMFPKFYAKLLDFALKIVEGIKSIYTMKHRAAFILHTVFIWLMYVLMIYICIFAVQGLEHLSFTSIAACFVMGSFAIVLVQGGIGAYPLAIMQTLLLYNIDKPLGLALGWIVWTSQTLMIIVVGMISFIIMNNKTLKLNQSK